MSERYETYEEEVSAATVSAYAAATDDDNPCYRDTGALAPPMFVVTMSVPHGLLPVVSDPEVVSDPTRLLSLLHAEEEIRFHRVTHVGDRLRLTPRLIERSQKSSGELLVVGTEVVDAQGALVAETRSSLLIRDRRPAGLARESSKSEAAPKPTPLFSRHWTVAPDQSLRYAEASGDRNPIHTDEAVARMVGLKGTILHGLCTMAFAQRAIIDAHLDGDPSRLARLRVRFVKPVYNGDTLTLDAWTMTREGASGDLEFSVSNQDGQIVLAGGEADVRSKGA